MRHNQSQSRRVRIDVSFISLSCLIILACNNKTVQGVNDPRHFASTVSSRPLLVPTVGHTNGVGDIVFSRDGRFMLTGSGDQTACLWDFMQGAEIRRFRQETGGILYTGFGKDASEIFTGDEEGWLRKWNGATIQLQSEYKGHVGEIGHGYSYGHPFANSPDGTVVFIARDDGTGLLTHLGRHEEAAAVELKVGEVGYAQFAPNGEILVVAGHTGTVAIRIADLHAIWRSAGAGPIAISGDGTQVLTPATDNNPVELRSLTNGTVLGTLPIASIGIFGLALSRNGKMALTATYPGVVDLWDVEMRTKRYSRKYNNNVSAIAFSPEDQSFVVADWDGTIQVFQSQPVKLERTLSGSASDVHWVGFVGNSLRILASDYHSGAGYYWNTTSTSPVTILEGHRGRITSAAASVDGLTAMTGSEDRSASLWSLPDGRELHRLDGFTQYVSSLGYTSSGRLWFVGGGATIVTEKPWMRSDIPTSRDLFSSPFLGALSDDGTRFVSSAAVQGPLWSWSKDGETKVQHKDDTLIPLAFLPGSHKVMVAAPKALGVWDTERASWSLWRDLPTPPHAAVPIRKGSAAVFLGDNGEVGEIELSSGAYRTLFRAPEPVVHVAVSDDDSFVAVAGSATYLWSRQTSEIVARFVLFNDGRWLVVDREGRFDSNQLRNDAAAYWLFDDSPFELLAPETFMRDFLEPSLAKRILGREGLRAVPLISAVQRKQPVVGPVVVDLAAGGTASVTADVRSPALRDGEEPFAVTHVQLFIDGALRDEVTDRILLRSGESRRIVYRDVKLPTADTERNVVVSVAAFAETGVRSRLSRVEVTSAPTTRKRRAFILGFGVSESKNRNWRLRYPDKDARDFVQVTRSGLLTSGVFDPISILLVSDATKWRREPDGTVVGPSVRQGLERVLGWMGGEAAPEFAAMGLEPPTADDIGLFLISTHGVVDHDGMFYMAPQDISGSDRSVAPDRLKSWVSAAVLRQWLKRLPLRDVGLWIDACESRSAVASTEFKPGPFDSRSLGQLAYDKKLRIVAAAEGEAVAESQLANSLLTYAVVHDGIERFMGDFAPRDGVIGLSEWMRYSTGAQQSSQELSSRLASQQPTLFDYADGAFVPVAGSAIDFVGRTRMTQSASDDAIDGAYERVRDEHDARTRIVLAHEFLRRYRRPLYDIMVMSDLLDSLIDVHGDSAEIAAVCIALVARLRAPDEQVLRISALTRAADELLSRKSELDAALRFAEDAQELGTVAGADPALQAELDDRVRQARRLSSVP